VSDRPLDVLPRMDELLERPRLVELSRSHGRTVVAQAARKALERIRDDFRNGTDLHNSVNNIETLIVSYVTSDWNRLRRAINATGVLLHTGLGRAPLASEAVAAAAEIARGYCNLEIDLESGERGRRSLGVEQLLTSLTGAEAAEVVNNNAAATVLTLRVLGKEREVVVSRGELVEIGGQFRLPEIFEASGAILREVGTTNRTREADYEQAIGPNTAAILRVHPSNYRIVGFVESTPLEQLVALGGRFGIPVIDDVGSGALDRTRPATAGGEPTLAGSIALGADVVLGSGDKLLGGPQCGVLAGKRTIVERLRRDPLIRAMRLDKLVLSALEATLLLARDETIGRERIPIWRYIGRTVEELKVRSERIIERLAEKNRLNIESALLQGFIGGGSAPQEAIASAGFVVRPPFPESCGGSEDSFAKALRLANPSVVARVREQSVYFDLRAVEPEDDETLIQTIAGVAK
jgi:L-seryl-tRNA(Ser) seleniumtransferase